MNRLRYVRKDLKISRKMKLILKISSKSCRKRWIKSVKTVSCGSNTAAWTTSRPKSASNTKFRRKSKMS